MSERERATVVLDDDPTGTQLLAGVPVVLRPDASVIRAAAATGRGYLHILTNSRALPADEAEQLVRETARSATEALNAPRLVLRGDSTLRAHLLEEWRAVRDVAFPGRNPVLLLAPALPSAGRVTVDGVHMLASDLGRVPVHTSDYARDPVLGYSTSHLLAWAEERSGGAMRADDGRVVPLDDLRLWGAEAVADALEAVASSGRAAACVVDAETMDDLRIAADGLVLAEERGVELIARGSPAFVAALSGRVAADPIPAPHAHGRGVLVVCGSYVAQSSLQIAELRRRHGSAFVELEIGAASGASAAGEVDRLAAAAAAALGRGGLAVVVTPRVFDPAAAAPEAGARIADVLAQVAGRLAARAAVVIAKGGITSAVVARDGLGAASAWVEGWIVPGVTLWRLDALSATRYVVFPGNVGAAETLADLVDDALGAAVW
jgi:uncharacterized protein YgbK (DUF1537 family)